MLPAAVSLDPGGQLDLSAVHLIKARKTHFEGERVLGEGSALGDWLFLSLSWDRLGQMCH